MKCRVYWVLLNYCLCKKMQYFAQTELGIFSSFDLLCKKFYNINPSASYPHPPFSEAYVFSTWIAYLYSVSISFSSVGTSSWPSFPVAIVTRVLSTVLIMCQGSNCVALALFNIQHIFSFSKKKNKLTNMSDTIRYKPRVTASEITIFLKIWLLKSEPALTPPEETDPQCL